MKKMDLEKTLSKIIQAIVRNYQPERVILFGSAASGNFSAGSDFDIAVVKKTNRRFYDRIGDVLRIVRDVENKPAIDFFVYTPEEFEKGKENNYFIRDEIEKKGKVLYDEKK